MKMGGTGKEASGPVPGGLTGGGAQETAAQGAPAITGTKESCRGITPDPCRGRGTQEFAAHTAPPRGVACLLLIVGCIIRGVGPVLGISPAKDLDREISREDTAPRLGSDWAEKAWTITGVCEGTFGAAPGVDPGVARTT